MSPPPATLPLGLYGGPGVLMEVGPARAYVRMSCADGEFPAPVRLDAKGAFSAEGQWRENAGGPDAMREDRVQVGADTRFTGRIEGDAVTLIIQPMRPAPAITLTLRRGATAKVIRCLPRADVRVTQQNARPG